MSEVEQLSFDNSDFKFVAAYNAYVKAFQASEDSEEKTKLNELISNLNEEKISYPDFYAGMNQFNSDPRHRFHRSKISTSRKFQYRKDERKIDRIKRHK